MALELNINLNKQVKDVTVDLGVTFATNINPQKPFVIWTKIFAFERILVQFLSPETAAWVKVLSSTAGWREDTGGNMRYKKRG